MDYVEIQPVGNIPSWCNAAFENALSRMNQIITSLPRLVSINGTVEKRGLLIKVSVTKIDGAGNVLGRAGPTLTLRSDGLPIEGIMEFDEADLLQMYNANQLDDVILHEMFHVCGFGTLWGNELITGASSADPIYTGWHALAEYRKLIDHQTSGIPLANTGGEGTRDSHWRESVFVDELCTGFITGSIRPLSRMTIASLADIGYSVDMSKADPYALTPSYLRNSRKPGVRYHTIKPEVKVIDDVVLEMAA